MKHVLSGVVDELNKEKNSMTGLAPATAIKQKVVKLKHKYPLEDMLPKDGLYRYLDRELIYNFVNINWLTEFDHLDRDI